MTFKEELEQIQKEKEALNERERDVFRRSLEAEEGDKICDDRWAKGLAEPEKGRIKYPISVTGIDFGSGEMFHQNRVKGSLVSIRPCADEYENKTFLGVYIGDLATSQMVRHSRESGVLSVSAAMHNPAIFVPDLNKVIFGYESWWGEIKSVDQVRKITDEDIEGAWYVKLLKEQLGGQ